MCVPALMLLLSSMVSDDASLLAQAQTAFQAAKQTSDPKAARQGFCAAAEHYEKLVRMGVANADIFNNQGNAYWLCGDLPRAILAYRRGLRLAPRDAGLRQSLAFARDQANSDSADRLNIGTSWITYLSLPLLLSMAFASYAGASVAFTRWLMVSGTRYLCLTIILFFAAALLSAVATMQYREALYESEHPLVVIARDGLILRKGNGASYSPARESPLNRGLEAHMLYRRGNWLQIALPGGEVGWISEKEAVVDE